MEKSGSPEVSWKCVVMVLKRNDGAWGSSGGNGWDLIPDV